MGFGGSNSLPSIGNVASNTAAPQGDQAAETSDDYETFLVDTDMTYRLIEAEFGAAAAEAYRHSATLRRQSNDREDREQTAARTALKAIFSRRVIREALMKFKRRCFFRRNAVHSPSPTTAPITTTTPATTTATATATTTTTTSQLANVSTAPPAPTPSPARPCHQLPQLFPSPPSSISTLVLDAATPS